MEVYIAWPGREELKVQLKLDDNKNIISAELQGIGGPEFVKAIKNYRGELKGLVSDLSAPTGSEPHEIMLREMVLRLKGQWSPPYKDEEVCHCRVVATTTVDLAICTGAHTSRQVSELTAASTACGTCRPDVEAMIKYRLTGS